MVVFAIFFDCGNRSSWKKSIDQKFLQRSILVKQHTINHGTHLAHVFHGKECVIMSEYLFNFIEVIVEILFDIDSNATVWIESPPYTTKKFISYSFYMGEVITKLDDKFRDAALEIVKYWKEGSDKNNAKVKEFLSLIDRALANLCQGDPNINPSLESIWIRWMTEIKK